MFNYNLVTIAVTVIYSILGIWHYFSIVINKISHSVDPPKGFRNEMQFLEFLMGLKSQVISELYRIKNDYLSEHIIYFVMYMISKFLSPVIAVGIYFGLEKYAGEILSNFPLFPRSSSITIQRLFQG